MDLYAVTATIVGGGLALRAWRRAAGRRPTLRLLPGLGTVAVPRRLEDRAAEPERDGAIFRFDRVASGWHYIGSLTPIRERLTVGVWAGEDATGAVPPLAHEFRRATIERVEAPRWRHDGDFEIGEGTHEVNTNRNPAWVLLHRPPGGALRFGYMAWQRDATLPQARATLRRAAASVVLRVPPERFLAELRAGPAGTGATGGG